MICQKKSGFTILELIVVIAVIATLGTVMTIFISGPKNKTADAVVKAQIKEISAQSEAYYIDNNYNYSNMCTTDMVIMTALEQISFNSLNFGSSGGDCQSDPRDWVVWAELKGGGTWCADSRNFSAASTKSPSGNYCE